MSAVVYTQRFKPVNLISAPNKNAEHIRYIGTRPGAMKNEGEKHGLFGNIYNSSALEVNHKIQDVMDSVRQKSQDGKNIYRSVISFAPDNAALKLGEPITKDAWQELVKQNIGIIARENNIKISNLRWVAAAHDTPTHPHVHIAFWDDKQEIIKNKISPQIPNKIRVNLIKNIFEDELKEYYEQKKQTEIRMKDITNEMAQEFEKHLIRMTAGEYSEFSNESSDVYENPDGHLCEYLARRLFEIRKDIPKGAFKFQYLKPDVKEKLISLVRELVDLDENLQEAISDYVESKIGAAKMYTTDEIELDALADKYEKEAEKFIANKVLRLAKKFNEKEWNIKSEEYNVQMRMQFAERLLTEIFASLSKLTQQKGKASRLGKSVMGSDMSKQARKEKARELESTGWDIEK
ncbi:MAG TPA: MobP3 family relaxase [Ruminiclostridium sp.]